MSSSWIGTKNRSYTPRTVATPTFSPAAGSYLGTQSVIPACTTPGSSIWYTVDGTTPVVISGVPQGSTTLFIAPINVAASETIKAIATASGFITSAIASASYTITSAVFDFFIAPNGDDNNPGTLSSPWSITAFNTKMSTYSGKKVGIIGDIAGVQTPIQFGTVGGDRKSVV